MVLIASGIHVDFMHAYVGKLCHVIRLVYCRCKSVFNLFCASICMHSVWNSLEKIELAEQMAILDEK